MKAIIVLALFASRDWGDAVQPSMTYGVVSHVAFEWPYGVVRQYVRIDFHGKEIEALLDGKRQPFVNVGQRLRICKRRAIYRRAPDMIGDFL